MDKNEFVDKLFSERMTRREFKKTLGAAGLSLVTIPVVSRFTKAAEGHPTIFSWSHYEDPSLHPSYIEKYGESPNYAFFGDEEEAFAKLQAGFKPDVTMPCSYKIPQWHAAGMLAPIDETRLSNWPDVIPSLKAVPGTIIDGKRYWVCMDWGQTSVVYRTDFVDIEEESWGILWDERYKGRLSMVDSLADGVMVAAIYAGAKDPFDMTPDEVLKTRELLRDQRPLLSFYSNSATDIEQALATGEVVAAVTWNDSYIRLVEQGLPVKFMNPKEGAMTWACGIALSPWTENLDRVYDFIDAMIGPRAGQFEIENWGYGHANLKAFNLVDEKDLISRGLTKNPEDLLGSGIFQAPIQNEPELQAMFDKVKAGF